MQSSSRIGKYELLSRLGRGGMGEVYKAFHPQLQRYVAIKVLLTNSETDPEFIARFQREAMAVAQLRHPHIVQVFDFDIEGDKPYMVMEYLEGETLAQRMARYHKSGQLLPTEEIIRLFQQICSAVDYAHKQGMLHRDIKPSNVILNRQNDAILTDFGLAKITGVSGLTASGLVVGTPHYMSPEQAQGQAIDARSDVYSLSIMLYEMLAGKLPFDADTPVAIIMQHITAPPPPIELANPGVPRPLAEVALVGMAKNPHERFRSAGALGAAIGTAKNQAQEPTRPAEPGQQRWAAAPQNQPQMAADPQPAQRTPSPSLATQMAPETRGGQLPPTTQPNAPSPAPAPHDPAGFPPGFTDPPPQRANRLGKFALIGLIVMLLAIGGGIFAIALGNKSAAPTTTNTSPTTVGTLVFTDSDPNDFTHPANVLTGAFNGLRQPAKGTNFFAWLCDASTSSCTLIGALQVDANGKATLSAKNNNGFLAIKNAQAISAGLKFEITQEQTEASSPPAKPSAAIVYAGQIEGKVLVHIRHQITLFPKQGLFAENTTALDIGLGLDAVILQQLSQGLVQQQADNNLAALQLTAEEVFNLIQGKSGAHDLNDDGQVSFWQGENDLSDDGFGMGTDATVNPANCSGPQNSTYLPLVLQHACLAASASGSAALMELFTMLRSAGTNLASLLSSIAQLAQKIATAQNTSAVFADVNTLAQDADGVLNGTTSETQNQPGARQMLVLSEQMATITVSAV
jgi:serine/threonine protein kinase